MLHLKIIRLTYFLVILVIFCKPIAAKAQTGQQFAYFNIRMPANEKMGPGIMIIDKYEDGTQFLKNLEPIDYTVTKNIYNFKVVCDSPTNINLFFKDIWISPNDTVNVAYKILSENPYRDTLIFTGNNKEKFAIYPLISNNLIPFQTSVPRLYPKKTVPNISNYKIVYNNFFNKRLAAIKQALKKIDTSATTQSGKTYRALTNEFEFWKLAMYTSSLLNNNLPIDSATIVDIKKLPYNNTRWSNNAYENLQLHEAYLKAQSKISYNYYQHLYEYAMQYSGILRDVLLLNTASKFRTIHNNNDTVQQKLARLNTIIENTVEDEVIKERVETHFGNLKLNTKELLLENYKGDTVTLENVLTQLSNNPIYVDIWASWCVPCRDEFVYARKRQQTFKNIHYLYISVDENADAWKKAMKEESISDTNSFRIIPKKDAELQKFIKGSGIPYYFLLNNTGKLLVAAAPRPSSDEFEKLFTKP